MFVCSLVKRKVKSVQLTAVKYLPQGTAPTHSSFAYHNPHQQRCPTCAPPPPNFIGSIIHVSSIQLELSSLQPFFFDPWLYIYMRKKKSLSPTYLFFTSVFNISKAHIQSSNEEGERCRGGVESSPRIPVPSHR